MRVLLAFILAVSLIGCGGSDDAPVVRVELSSQSVLLGPSDTFSVIAIAYDTDGNQVDADITWTSDDASIATATGGSLTGVALGSTTVRAVAEDVEATLFVWVAQPAPGAVLFSDDQVTSGPTLVAGGPNLVGAHFELGLSGVSASTGDLLIPRGDTRAAGRVAAVNGDTYDVEIVPLTDLFEAVKVSASGPLPSGQSRRGAFEVGPFECETDGDVEPDVNTDELTYDINPDLDYDFDFDMSGGDLQHALVRLSGSVSAEAHGTIGFPLDLSGEVTCKVELASPVIPVAGALSWLIAPKVPLGIGLTLEGEAEVEVSVDIDGSVGAAVTVGFEYDPTNGLVSLNDFDFEQTIEASLDVPALAADARAEARIYAFGFAELEVGLTLSDDASISLVEVDAGLQQKAELAHPIAQTADEDYASTYELALHGEVAAGEDVNDFLEYLGLDDSLDLSADHDIPLGTSPTGTFSFAPAAVTEGVEVTGTVVLDAAAASYPIVGYNVSELRIYGVVGDAEDLILVDTLTPTGEQTTWDWAYTPDANDVAANITSFAAFAVTVALPGVPLELSVQSALDCSDTNTFTAVETMADLLALSGTTQFEGNLRISNIAGLTDLSALAGLTDVCRLWLWNLPDLTSLSGLEDLQSVTQLYMLDVPQLTDLSGLEGVDAISTLHLENVPITSLAPLSGATFVDMGCPICSRLQLRNTALTTLDGIGNTAALLILYLTANELLTDMSALAVTGEMMYVHISQNPLLGEVRGLESVSKLELLGIGVNDSLTAVHMDGLTEVSSTTTSSLGITYGGNSMLTSTGLSNVVSVSDINITNSPLLTIGMPKLETITGYFYLQGNAAMTSLGLPALTAACMVEVGSGLPNLPAQAVTDLYALVDANVCAP